MQIPNHVTNYSIFKDGRRLIGLADVTLPHLQNQVDELKGSGIFWTIEMPNQSHFQSMVATLNWLTVVDDALFASIQDGAQLDAWAAHQLHDSATNKIIHTGWRYVMGVAPKSFNLGKLEVGAKGEAVSEYELISLRVFRNDQVVAEIDKENAVCRWWNGVQIVDSALRIRQLIGL
jgi:P2 family phage contractile tail tube protein